MSYLGSTPARAPLSSAQIEDGTIDTADLATNAVTTAKITAANVTTAKIADANITTLLAALVLFSFGTGPIKGFAVTLSLGILSSMFTAIMVSRGLVNLIYGRRRLEKLKI